MRANHAFLGSLMIIAAPMFDQRSLTGSGVAVSVTRCRPGTPEIRRFGLLSCRQQSIVVEIIAL